MIDDAQIVKGLLEGCILSLFEQEELYGYKAVELLNQRGFRVNEATVYPILTRLEIKGCLLADKRPSPLGPTRKYYRLTQPGQVSLQDFRETWAQVSRTVNAILQEGESK
jgi:PadR family transcriptional regulator, regulatory protein PadR